MFELKTIEITEIEGKKAVTAVVKSAQALVELTEWVEIEDGIVTIEMVDSNMCMNQSEELDALGIECTTELAMAMQGAAQELIDEQQIKIIKEDEGEKAPMLCFDGYEQMMPAYLMLDIENGEFYASNAHGIDRNMALANRFVLLKIDATLSGKEINELIDHYADDMRFIFNNYSSNPVDEKQKRALELATKFASKELDVEYKLFIVDNEADLVEFAQEMGYEASDVNEDYLESIVDELKRGDDANYVKMSKDEIEDALLNWID
ncbi:hypothetical protein P5E67_00655 [Vibrio parahaemolyticus]|nr:hypothetical protein [Vibrio parahaemolyticus]